MQMHCIGGLDYQKDIYIYELSRIISNCYFLTTLIELSCPEILFKMVTQKMFSNSMFSQKILVSQKEIMIYFIISGLEVLVMKKEKNCHRFYSF